MKIYDPDIRKVMLNNFFTIEEFMSDSSTKLINEMDVCLGVARVDIAIINGKLHGYEIKSKQDTLERLPFQIESYNKVFDTMTIVTCENHIEKVKELVPKWWGIYYISDKSSNLSLKKIRKARDNKSTDILSLSQLLWKDELIELLNRNGFIKGTKSKTRSALCDLVADKLPITTVKFFVRETLKSRESWRAVPLQQLYDDWH
jgi:hypothetical protein